MASYFHSNLKTDKTHLHSLSSIFANCTFSKIRNFANHSNVHTLQVWNGTFLGGMPLKRIALLILHVMCRWPIIPVMNLDYSPRSKEQTKYFVCLLVCFSYDTVYSLFPNVHVLRML